MTRMIEAKIDTKVVEELATHVGAEALKEAVGMLTMWKLETFNRMELTIDIDKKTIIGNYADSRSEHKVHIVAAVWDAVNEMFVYTS